MPCQERDLIVGHRGGCIGCSCALAWHRFQVMEPDVGFRSQFEGGTPSLRGITSNEGRSEGVPPSNVSSGWRLAQAALLVFGAPLLLLLLSAAGTAAFAAEQPAWALVGLAPLLGIAAGGHGRARKAFLALTLRQSHHSHRRNDR